MIKPLLLSLLVLLPAVLGLAPLDPSFWSKIDCSSPRLPTPTFGDQNPVYTVCSSLIINAPVSKVHEAILDFNRYPVWNSFVRSIDLPKGTSTPSDVQVGLEMTFHNAGLAPFGFQVTSQEKMTVVQPPSETTSQGFAASAWKFDVIDALLAAEHPNLLTDLGNGSTLYVSYEAYYAPLSYLSAILKDKLKERFDSQAMDLKRYVEGKQDGRSHARRHGHIG